VRVLQDDDLRWVLRQNAWLREVTAEHGAHCERKYCQEKGLRKKMPNRNLKIYAATKAIQASVPVVDKLQKTLADLQRYANHGNKGQVKMILLDKLKQERLAVEQRMDKVWEAVRVICEEMNLNDELHAEAQKRESAALAARKAAREKGRERAEELAAEADEDPDRQITGHSAATQAVIDAHNKLAEREAAGETGTMTASGPPPTDEGTDEGGDSDEDDAFE
jgi:hypothetical protein